VAGVVNLTTHLHPVPRSRMRGAIPPLPNTPPRRSAQLKEAQGQLQLLSDCLSYVALSGRMVSE
jgi:hypothetical protein